MHENQFKTISPEVHFNHQFRIVGQESRGTVSNRI